MSKKFYAVKVGKKPGVYTTWDECKEQVNKFPGSIYKSFKMLEEAEKFAGIKVENISKKSKTNVKSKLTSESKDKKCNYDMIAFVDGSYDRVSKTFGSGIAVIDIEKDLIQEYKTAGHDKWDQWNIVGEIEAAKYAIKLAHDEGLKKLCIYHDLKNISLWAAGTWQAKNEYTQSYVRFVEDYSKDLSITFIKVKGHSCNKYNDIADRLAREAIEEYL